MINVPTSKVQMFNKVQGSPLTWDEGLKSLFGLDEKQGDKSGFKAVDALSWDCRLLTRGESGLSVTLGDTGLSVGIGLIWDRYRLTVLSVLSQSSGI